MGLDFSIQFVLDAICADCFFSEKETGYEWSQMKQEAQLGNIWMVHVVSEISISFRERIIGCTSHAYFVALPKSLHASGALYLFPMFAFCSTLRNLRCNRSSSGSSGNTGSVSTALVPCSR